MSPSHEKLKGCYSELFLCKTKKKKKKKKNT